MGKEQGLRALRFVLEWNDVRCEETEPVGEELTGDGCSFRLVFCVQSHFSRVLPVSNNLISSSQLCF